MMIKSFDVIVIGGGTAGLRTAFHAANSGKKTALINSEMLGGTCLNVGCIPTKALLEASHMVHQVSRASSLGISVSQPKINFSALMKRVHCIVGEGVAHVHTSVKTKNLTLITGHACFVDKKVVEVNGKKFTGKKFVIATGSHARRLTIPGSESVSYMVSKDVLKLKKLPKSIGIIGAGYIAMEFATFFSELGVKVCVVGRAPRVLPAINEEVSLLLQKQYEKKGVTFYVNAEARGIKQVGKKKEIVFRHKKSSKVSSVVVDEILVAIGRVPNTADLGLDAAGIRTYKNSGVRVNSYLQTTNPDVYAMGDVIGRTMFAHMAKRGSIVVLNNLYRKDKLSMPFSLVPWAIFTNPPVAGIGLNEAALREKKIPFKIAKAEFSSVGRARIIDDTRGFVKVFYHKKSEKILGAVMCGPSADIIIHEIIALMNMNAKFDDLKRTVHIHPTLSEIFSAFY